MSNNLVRQILKAGGSLFVGASIAIGTLSPIVLNSSRVLADATYSNIPTDAQNNLNNLDILHQNINAKSIAFTPNGGYAILYKKNDAVGNNLPPAFVSAIQALQQQDSTINTIAFTPSGEGVIIYDDYGYSTSNNFPQDALDELATLNQQGSIINNIAFTPNGEWVIIFDGNGYSTSDNFPQDVLNKLATLNQQGSTINSVAFNPNGGWAILYDKNGYAYNGISKTAADAIVAKSNLKDGLINIAFTPSNGYVLLFSDSLAQLQIYEAEQQAYQSLGY